MIITDDSPSNISSKIKELIQAKAVEKIDEIRPEVAAFMFSDEEEYQEEE